MLAPAGAERWPLRGPSLSLALFDASQTVRMKNHRSIRKRISPEEAECHHLDTASGPKSFRAQSARVWQALLAEVAASWETKARHCSSVQPSSSCHSDLPPHRPRGILNGARSWEHARLLHFRRLSGRGLHAQARRGGACPRTKGANRVLVGVGDGVASIGHDTRSIFPEPSQIHLHPISGLYVADHRG